MGMTAHQQLRRTNPAKGYVAGSCNVLTVGVIDKSEVGYLSKEGLDGAIASGRTGGFGETFEQLDELLGTLGTSVGRP